MKRIISYAALVILLINQGFSKIENSIVPLIERYEVLDNLSKSKYSDRQFYEIRKGLSHKDERVRLVSYNVLFNIFDQNLEKANRWKFRLPRVVELLDEISPDILCVQELYPSQLEDLMGCIGDRYAFYAMPCVDGELNGIFYLKDRFKLVDWQVWSLTRTPEIPSSEALTMVHLKDLKAGSEFAVFNTHLSFSKINKRDFQACAISEILKAYEGKLPVILTGDFNTFPNRLDLEKLPALDGDYVCRILTQRFIRDAKDVSLLGHLGPLSTFTNDPEGVKAFCGYGTPGVFLDHIFVSPEVKILIHGIQPAKVDGQFPSDHMPLLVDFYINSEG